MEAIKSNWMVQDFYNQYLTLKEEIRELTHRLHQESFPLTDDNKKALEVTLTEKVKEFRIVLKDLELRGVDLTNLILLSIGVEVNG